MDGPSWCREGEERRIFLTEWTGWTGFFVGFCLGVPEGGGEERKEKKTVFGKIFKRKVLDRFGRTGIMGGNRMRVM